MLRNLFLLAALLFSFIVAILVVYRPIHEAVMLRYYYTPEEIRRGDLHVVEIVNKRDIIFSNGEQRAYETGLKVVFLGIAGGLVLAWLVLSNWAVTRFGHQSVGDKPTEEPSKSGRTIPEPDVAADPARDIGSRDP